MTETRNISPARAALPIMLGYAAIGIPCGILSASIGMNAWQVLIMCVLFYSGAGQFMIPNMWLAGAPIPSIVLSVSLVNTRQMLYSASLAKFSEQAKRGLAFLFAATVTDESFGVNTALIDKGGWSVREATLVNLCSQTSWTVFNVLGVLVGHLISIPLAIASFAMTAIFICLAATQRLTPENLVAIGCAFVGVYVGKLIGLAGFAIVFGAVLGVIAAFAFSAWREKRGAAVGADAVAEPAADGVEGTAAEGGEGVGVAPVPAESSTAGEGGEGGGEA